MSGAIPPRAVPRADDAEVPPITLGDAIGLGVPLCFVVEPDGLWAECAIEALLEEYAESGDSGQGAGVPVARWTRTRRWRSFGAGFGFGLAGSDAGTDRVDVLEEIVRLSEHLASAKPSDGTHPFCGALFSIRGMEPELERPVAAEVLLDVVRQLLACRGTLLVELSSDPAEGPAVATLGPVFRLPRSPRRRYEAAISAVRSAARSAGAPEPDVQAVADALSGSTRLQAEIAARIVEAESELRGPGVDVLQVLASARRRVGAVLGGVPE